MASLWGAKKSYSAPKNCAHQKAYTWRQGGRVDQGKCDNWPWSGWDKPLLKGSSPHPWPEKFKWRVGAVHLCILTWRQKWLWATSAISWLSGPNSRIGDIFSRVAALYLSIFIYHHVAWIFYQGNFGNLWRVFFHSGNKLKAIYGMCGNGSFKNQSTLCAVNISV